MSLRNILVPLIFLTIAFYSPIVKAHDNYPDDCCSGQDCKPIACKEIKVLSNGDFLVSGKDTFSKDKLRDPIDNQCHVCYPYGNPGCIMLPRIQSY